MDRRSAPAAAPVAAALEASGVTADSLAQATDIPSAVMRERLSDESSFTLTELGRVGGFFRIHPADLVRAIA
jgi:hypothetical protein